ncbi:MAG: PEP-CTERM sorting domain-containing protein [Mariniblastus sp.]|nr:PEP-CTERM sorting domain-containing protein [Mariniblastus sp.]
MGRTMLKARLPLFALVSCVMTAGMFSTSHADLVNITDGTNTFQWNPDDNSSSITSVYGDYSATFMPMLRYTNSNEGLKTLSLADYSGTNTRRMVVQNSATNNGSTAQFTALFGTQVGDFQNPNWDLQVTLNFEIGSNDFGTVLNYDMKVENVSSATQTNVEMFQYYDWDVVDNQNTGQDYGIGDYTGFLQVGSSTAGQPGVFHGTDNFSNWEVAAWDSIQTKLLANGSLTNSGTPFSTADMTAAFGWNVGSMAAGSSSGPNRFLIQGVPEPGSAAILMIGFLGTVLVRRRKS